MRDNWVLASIFIVVLLIFPTWLTISWLYYKKPVGKRNKKEYFINWLMLMLANVIFLPLAAEFPYTINIINMLFIASIYMFYFLTNSYVTYFTAVFIIYIYLSIMIFRTNFLKRSVYWLRKLILHDPSLSDYPEPIRNLHLLGLFVLSIVIVQITSFYSYIQSFLPDIYWLFEKGGILIFILPLVFNFIIYFLFKSIIILIRFVGRT